MEIRGMNGLAEQTNEKERSRTMRPASGKHRLESGMIADFNVA